MSYYFSRVVLRYPVQDMTWFAQLCRKGDAYRDHALIWKLFPGDGMERDFVFRRDLHEQGRLRYYVVSKRKPDVDSVLFDVQTKPYQPQLDEGEMLRFDLRVNPTVTKKNGEKSARHDVLMQAKKQWKEDGSEVALDQALHRAATQWLTDRAEKWGLLLNVDSLQTEAYMQHQLSGKKKQDIAFSSLDYQGIVQVKDALLLNKALCDGVGHSKAFGCGLLLVRRAT